MIKLLGSLSYWVIELIELLEFLGLNAMDTIN
jgi:hypothetical protein